MARISKSLVAARSFTILISATSIAVYVLLLLKVTTDTFVADQPGITALPLIPLSLTVLWNLTIILLTLTKLSISRWVSVFDIELAVSLIVLGVIAFVHDDSAYYRDGVWRQYIIGSNMVDMEIAAITCLGVAVILEVLITLLTFRRLGERTRVDRGLKSEDIPPAYDQVKGDVGGNGKSLNSYEGFFETEKKANSTETYQ